MKRIKYFPLLIIFVFFAIPLISCQGDWRGENLYTEVVHEIPADLVLIPKGGGNWDNGLHYTSWDNILVFLDADEVNIYQVGYNNSDFILKYKDEYYVNEEKFLEIMDVANSSCEVRARRYSLEDAVEIRGAGKTIYTVKITKFEVERGDGITIYSIKQNTTSNFTEVDHRNFITQVETKSGVSYSKFEFIVQMASTFFRGSEGRIFTSSESTFFRNSEGGFFRALERCFFHDVEGRIFSSG